MVTGEHRSNLGAPNLEAGAAAQDGFVLTDRPSNAMLAATITIALGVLGVCAGWLVKDATSQKTDLAQEILGGFLIVVLFIAILFSFLHVTVVLLLLGEDGHHDFCTWTTTTKTAILKLSFIVFAFALVLALILEVGLQINYFGKQP